MATIPNTVDVDCPRCKDQIQCTLKVDPAPAKPGATVRLTVPDLAERMAAHYRDAHPAHMAEATASKAGQAAGKQFAEAMRNA